MGPSGCAPPSWRSKAPETRSPRIATETRATQHPRSPRLCSVRVPNQDRAGGWKLRSPHKAAPLASPRRKLSSARKLRNPRR
jgi:hypothetical protein